MAEKSVIRDEKGKTIAVRTVKDSPDGGKVVTTQEAFTDPITGTHAGKIVDERKVHADGREYKRK
jgi:hypothetical protein